MRRPSLSVPRALQAESSGAAVSALGDGVSFCVCICDARADRRSGVFSVLDFGAAVVETYGAETVRDKRSSQALLRSEFSGGAEAQQREKQLKKLLLQQQPETPAGKRVLLGRPRATCEKMAMPLTQPSDLCRGRSSFLGNWRTLSRGGAFGKRGREDGGLRQQSN